MKIKDRKTIYEGFFKVEQVTVEHQGQLLKRDMVTNKDAVAALIYHTRRQEYLLVEQYRVPAAKKLLEIVAGLVDKPGETLDDTIKREIEEEVGFAVDELEFISTFYSTPGSYSEKIWLYYAEVSRQVGAGGGLESEQENLETVALTREKLLSYPFEDAKTLVAVYWLKARGL